MISLVRTVVFSFCNILKYIICSSAVVSFVCLWSRVKIYICFRKTVDWRTVYYVEYNNLLCILLFIYVSNSSLHKWKYFNLHVIYLRDRIWRRSYQKTWRSKSKRLWASKFYCLYTTMLVKLQMYIRCRHDYHLFVWNSVEFWLHSSNNMQE